MPRAVRRALARLVRLGVWDAADDRHPGRDPAAGATLLERLRAAGYAAAIATTPPHPKSGRQDAPEYTVTLTTGHGRTVCGAGSRLERAAWRAARELA